MAIALVQATSKQVSGTTSTTISLPSAATAGNCVVVFTSSWAGQSSSVTDNQSGNTYSSLVNAASGSNEPAVRIWAALNVNASGTFTATVNFSPTADATVIIAEFSGVVTSAAAEVANTATGTSSSPSVSTNGATTDAGDIVIGIVTHAGGTIAITQAGTLIAEQENNSTSQGGNAQYTLPGSTGVKTLSWTLGSSEPWLAAVVALKPAAGGNISVTPSPATCSSATVAPAIVLSNVTVAPAVATCSASVVAPAVRLSNVTVTPAAASASTAAVAPTLGLPSGAYRLFLNDNGPAALSDAYAISLSMEFTVSADCEVTHLHYWRGASDVPSGQAGRIYQVGNSTALASVNFASDVGVGWQTAALSTPLALSAGTSYFVTVYFPTGRFASTANFWDTGAGASGRTNGILSAPNNASATSGIGQSPFSFGIDAYPYSAAVSATNYWVDVTVRVNDITVTPAAATCSAVTVTPSVVLSNVTIAPTAASASSATIAPVVTLGSVTIAPAPAEMSAVSVAPTVTLSGITVSPAPSEASAVSIAPSVTLGTITLTPIAASAQAATIAPSATLSGVSVTPSPAICSVVTTAPNVIQTGLSVTPQPATVNVETIAPDVTLSTVAVTSIASASAVTNDPTVVIVLTPLYVKPAPATCSTSTLVDVLIFIPTHPTPPMSGIGIRAGARVAGRAGAHIGMRRRT